MGCERPMTTQEDTRLLSTILENAPTLIVMARPDGNIIYANRNAFGLSQTDLIGKSVLEFMDEGYRSGFKAAIADVLNSNEPAEFLFSERDDVWIRIRIGPICTDKTVESLIFTSNVITDQIKAQRELQQSERMLRSLLDESPEGIMLTDEQGNIIEWNRAQEDIFGLSSEEVRGRKIWNIQHMITPGSSSPEAHDVTKAKYLRFFETGDIPGLARSQESNIILKDGDMITVQQYLAPIKTDRGYMFCAFIHDITLKREAEKQKEEAERRYRALFELNNDAIFILDLQGNHLEVNERAAEIMGYSREELLGLSYRDIIVERQQHETRRRLDEISEMGSYEIYERVVKRKDGIEIPVEVNISLVRDSKGEPLHIQSIMRDISERKRIESILTRSERQYRELAEKSIQGIQIMQEDRVAYVNPAYAQIVGRTIDEIYALDRDGMWNIIHPDDRETIMSRFREYSKTGELQPSSRYRIVRPNGEIRWVEANVSIVEFDEKPAMQRTLVDITEGVKAEVALKEERDRVKMYLQMAGVIFLVLDVEGNITLINRKGTEVMGYSQDELAGTSWFDFIPARSRQQVRANFSELIQGEVATIAYIERELLTKKGDERLIAWHTSVLRNSEGKSIGVVSSGEDITEKRAAQQELKKSQDMLELVMNNIPQNVFWKDTYSKYLGCNEIFAINAGVDKPENIIGKHDLDLPWRENESEIFLEADRIILNGSAERYDNIESMRKADGTDALFRTIKVPLTDNDGNIIGVLGTAEDVTEKRKAEIELAQSEQKFRTLLQSLEDLVFKFDEEGKYVEYFSKDEEDLYVPPSEFLGKRITEVLPPEVSVPYAEAMERVRKTGKSETYDYPLPDHERMRWFSASISLHEDGVNTVSVIREITDKVEATRELEELSNIISVSPVVAFLWKEEPGRPVEFVTGNTEDLFGYDLSDLKSGVVSYRDIVHPDDLARVGQEMRGFRADRLCESYVHEPYRIVTKNGDIRWVADFTALRRDSEGNITHTQTVLTDITNRIRIEDALRESESKYRSVVEQSLMGIAIITLEGEIIFANRMLSRLLDIDIEELTSMKLADVVGLIHPEDLEATAIFRDRCFEGHEQSPIVVRILLDDSKTSWFEMFGSRVLYENKFAVQLGVVDITERFLAIEALRRERASFRSIAESAVLATETEEMTKRVLLGFMQAMNLEIGSIDLIDSKKTTLKPTAWIGVPDEIAMKDIPLTTEVADSYIIGRVAITKERIISSDITKDIDISQYPYLKKLGFKSMIVMPLVGKDGELIGVFSTGSTKANMIEPKDSVFYEIIAGLLVTVLERKQTEQAYRMSVRRYRELLTELSEGIGIVDLDEKFVFVNEAFCNMIGYEKEDLLGTDSRMVIHRDDRDRIRDETASRIKGISSTYQIRMIRKDGEERICRISAIPSRNDTGDVEGTLGFMTDITERVHAENEVRKLNEELAKRVEERTAELEAANKELESFAYTVSHDLRAPLRIIDGFSQAIEEDYGGSLDEAGRDYLSRIRSGVNNMAGLIEDILGLSRVTRAEMERVDVNLSRLAEEVATELQEGDPDRQPNVTIEPELIARCDKRLMRILLQNLFENSWKFTTNVDVPQISFGKGQVNGEEVFFVKDNGVGFSMEYAEKLFKPFQRLHRADEFEGSGIGLATVMRIITRHGGRIWAEAELGRGATFYFTLK